jgi:immune inhibitor A
MSGGSWNGSGVGNAHPADVPAHPSAWCKATQGWVNVTSQSHNAQITVTGVERDHAIYKLWKDGISASEYFLVENRQRVGFDQGLPGDGLLIWHIDESIGGNTNEDHLKVALLQAEGKRDLERAANRGDGGDPYPGDTQNRTFDATSKPSSNSYSGIGTSVALTEIPPSAAAMTVRLAVTTASAGRRRVVAPPGKAATLPARGSSPTGDQSPPGTKPTK